MDIRDWENLLAKGLPWNELFARGFGLQKGGEV
jgi:hypothetical protein